MLDYGVGNLHSLTKALERSGLREEVVPVEEGPGDADGIVLPGVGAFQPAAEALAAAKDEILDALDEGTPLLGVCLGMQLLAEGSREGPGEGLGVIEGRVERLSHERVPHIGWNTLEGPHEGPLSPLHGRHVYYVHSYVVPEDESVTAHTTYGDPFPAIVDEGTVLGTQFHPEKSSDAGRIVLDAFAERVEET